MKRSMNFTTIMLMYCFINLLQCYYVTSYVFPSFQNNQRNIISFHERHLTNQKQNYISNFVLKATKVKKADKAEHFIEEINLSDYDEDDDNDESNPNFGNPSTGGVKNDMEWMFFDVAKINVKGGDGGNGCMAMRREWKVDLGGPSGGNGGHGGNIYLECDETLNTLSLLRRKVHHRAGDGTGGKGSSQHGLNGNDIVIPVPPGTIIRDQANVLAGELNKQGQRLLVAKGGKGGRGNEHFKTPRNTAPSFCEKGQTGIDRWLNIELKLVADVGFVGVPNAGKSTLLAACSNAKPKIADYPFTTVVPNLGVCDIDHDAINVSGKGLVLADIPGLLEGAHTGKGLGLAFLRHIQRCRIIIHLIKGDSEDPINDYLAINQELELFNPKVANMTQVVVINKIDIPEVKEKLPDLINQLKSISGHTRVMGISAATKENVKELMIRVKKVIDSLPKQSNYELFTQEESRVNFSDEEDSQEFDIVTDEKFPGQFRVVGQKIEKVADVMNWDYTESLHRFQRILEAQGISDALAELGAKEGDLVMIGNWDFFYVDKKNQWITSYDKGEDMKPVQRPKFYDGK